MRFIPLALILLTGCSAHRAPHGPEAYELTVRGASRTQVDLLLDSPESDKIFIQVDLGLDDPALFLVDTGASVSVVNAAVVEALGLEPIPGRGIIEGMGGTTPWSSVVIPSMRIGDVELLHVEAAADVRGVPSFGGGPPLQGILGNNIWQNFVLTVDYPAARLELDRSGQPPALDTAVPMLFDGMHCYSFVQLDSGELTHQVLLAIDTGARGVLLSGFSGAPLASLATEGEEALMGIGTGEDLPATGFMRRTRRIPLDRVTIGGAVIEDPGDAQWVNFEGPVRIGPASMPGLVGHAVLKEHRVVFDIPGERFALIPSAGPERAILGHQVLLDTERDRHGDDPERAYYRARLLAWLEDEPGAAAEVRRYLGLHPDDPEATVFLARLQEYMGDLDAYSATLSALDAKTLGEQGELVSVVNTLVLAGQAERSLELAQAGVLALPDQGRTKVALADALLASGQTAGARRALAEANQLEESPDGHLLRRARVALAEQDRLAALAHTRRLLEVLPSSGFAIWFYQHLAESPSELATFERDLELAMARLHPGDRPLDFLMAAYVRLGQPERALDLLEEGLERDCEPLDEGASRSNCQAWYRAMAGADLDLALERSLAATSEHPHRSDYLDTLAMVHWRRGELSEALEAATAARRHSPADVYLAWQQERLAEALIARAGSADLPD
jgi:tetratricopeptide (TPR) repeat protein/predicted aspartyl protease